MALDATTQLSTAELVIYLILMPIVVYILIHHGYQGYLGWGFLIAFCGLRIASDGIQIGNHNNISNGSSGAIINSGLSALLYSLSGIMHECYHRVPNHDRKKHLVVQVVLHLIISGGIALSAAGGAKFAEPETPNNSHTTESALRKVGSITLFVSSILLVGYTVYTYRRLKSFPSTQLNRNAMHLLYFTILALPFTTVRSIYSVVYSFDSSPTVNPITGVFAIKLVLIFLVQLLAVLPLIVGGVLTRNVRLEDKSVLSGPGYVLATSSEFRRDSPSEEHMIGDNGDAQEHHAKSLRSGKRHAV